MTAQNTYEVSVKHITLQRTTTETYTVEAVDKATAGQRAIDLARRGRGGTAHIEHIRLLRRAHQPAEVDV